jgi:hypothetical protein
MYTLQSETMSVLMRMSKFTASICPIKEMRKQFAMLWLLYSEAVE